MTTFQQELFQEAARAVACDANENHFESRSGVYVVTAADGGEFLAVFNNNPWAHSFKDGTCPRRESDHADFIRSMLDIGIYERSRASYPTTGKSKGYTTAILLDAPHDCRREVARAYRAAIKTGQPDSIQTLEIQLAIR